MKKRWAACSAAWLSSFAEPCGEAATMPTFPMLFLFFFFFFFYSFYFPLLFSLPTLTPFHYIFHFHLSWGCDRSSADAQVVQIPRWFAPGRADTILAPPHPRQTAIGQLREKNCARTMQASLVGSRDRDIFHSHTSLDGTEIQ
ncbi:hypothetical protein B0T26DRAFT_36957 [Lasiosphaeria miniovina]|uniref:Uncharacterized protein n=1 Tax=Lasiosphaeria miniovina TaxID=1954250 RepID=A0AA40E9Y2_9PEZI|nr:uncharacterized protein B0T26DRAFT_36957 [Lasiosphaeria miniovina]KAK0733804.1 hypothetical protein B0T26DRAFT_36957 [Lasiosphaeria miniovina]